MHRSDRHTDRDRQTEREMERRRTAANYCSGRRECKRTSAKLSINFGSFYMHISMMSTINIRISVIKRNDKTGSVNVW